LGLFDAWPGFLSTPPLYHRRFTPVNNNFEKKYYTSQDHLRYDVAMWLAIIVFVVICWALGAAKKASRRATSPRRGKSKNNRSLPYTYAFEDNFERLCNEAEEYAQRHALDNHKNAENILRKKHMALVKQGLELLKAGGKIGNIVPPNGLVYWAKTHERDDIIAEFYPLFLSIGVNIDACITYWTTGDGSRSLTKCQQPRKKRSETWRSPDPKRVLPLP
jgi:hypothetical protein